MTRCFSILAAVLAVAVSYAADCGNGITGVKTGDGKYCCPSSCGTCGGPGCNTRAPGDVCCTSTFKTSCSAATKAPCIIGSAAPAPAPTAGGGGTGTGKCAAGDLASLDGAACCPSSCTRCGGNDCDKLPGGYLNCCRDVIVKGTAVCSASVKGPCKISTAAPAPAPVAAPTAPVAAPTAPVAAPTGTSGKCAAGELASYDGAACCTGSCGACGGTGCDKFNGGSANCCRNEIVSGTRVCSATVKAPCKIATAAPAPAPVKAPTPPAKTCAAGELTTGDVCCPKSCGACGGVGCDRFVGGPDNCCRSVILAGSKVCSATVTAPCKL